MKTNKDLQSEQLKTVKLFYEKGILTKEQYEYEVKVLTTRIDVKDIEKGDDE